MWTESARCIFQKSFFVQSNSLRPYDRRIECRPPNTDDFYGLQRKLQTKKNSFLRMQTVFSRCTLQCCSFLLVSYCFAFALCSPFILHFLLGICLQVVDTKNMPIKCIPCTRTHKLEKRANKHVNISVEYFSVSLTINFEWS